MKETTRSTAPFYTLYLATFLFAFHYALPIYINSSFLGSFLPETAVGFMYAAASLVGIIALVQFPRVLNAFGNYRTIIGLIVLQILFLLGLAHFKSAFLLAGFFIVSQLAITLALFCLDVFLESYSDDETTGSLRGTQLTIMHIAILLGPLTVGAVMTDSEFPRVFLLSAILLIPTLWLIVQRFSTFADPRYKQMPIKKALARVLADADLRHVFVSQLFLRFFYAWMVIYTPLYLYQHIGFSWSEIGGILTIMLLPFILLELPAGKLADSTLGEKELMVSGFLITALFATALAFASEPSVILWAALLFGTRIGASLVEITSESYFFKHISSADTELLSLFRMLRPVAYLIAPASASLLLIAFDIRYLFIILAGLLIFGAWYSFHMRDTK